MTPSLPNSPRPKTWAARIDWLFTRAAILAGFALIAMVGGIAYDFAYPGVFEQDIGFHSIGSTIYSIYMIAIIAIMAILPFVSLIYLVSGLFSSNAFDQKGLWLTTIAVLSSAIAVILAIDQSICDRLAADDALCLSHKFAFLFDQFSKGGFGDIFDLYDLKLAAISTSELTGIAKIYTLNFRMISALYLAMIVLALYRRFSKKETA